MHIFKRRGRYGCITTQDEQVDCFRNAAAHLEIGGCFVIETFIPELRLLPHGETIRPHQFNQSRFDFDEYNVATQELVSHHYINVDGAFRGHCLPFRYVWPSEWEQCESRGSTTALREVGAEMSWSTHPLLSPGLDVIVPK